MVNSRTKGASAERELVNLLKSNSIPAKRISMMETGGIDKGDLEIMGCYIAQVKKGSDKYIPKMIYDVFKNGEHFAFFRRDRDEWIISMKLDFFIEKFI